MKPAFQHRQRSLTHDQLAVAEDRQRILKAALPLFEAGITQAQVAPMLGISPATLSRLVNLCPAKSNASQKSLAKCRRLVKLPVACLAPKVASGGSESQFAALLKVRAAMKELRRLYILHRAKGHAQTVCRAVALQGLGYSKPMLELPPLGRKLRSGSQPKPLLEYLKHEFKPHPAPPRRPSCIQN